MTMQPATQHTHEPSLSLIQGCPRCEEIAGHLREERFDEAAAQRREDDRVEPGAGHEAPTAPDESLPVAAEIPPERGVPPLSSTPAGSVYPPRVIPAYCWLCSGPHDLLDCPRKEATLKAGDQAASVIRSVMKERGLVK